jgi:hypothetical protein
VGGGVENLSHFGGPVRERVRSYPKINPIAADPAFIAPEWPVPQVPRPHMKEMKNEM